MTFFGKKRRRRRSQRGTCSSAAFQRKILKYWNSAEINAGENTNNSVADPDESNPDGGFFLNQDPDHDLDFVINPDPTNFILNRNTEKNSVEICIEMKKYLIQFLRFCKKPSEKELFDNFQFL